MNKIFNWTFGSIFRTIGRIIAYILFAALLVFIAQSNDFKFPSWLFMKVNASTYKNSYFLTYYKESSLSNEYSNLSGGIVSYANLNSKTSATVSFNDTNFYFANQNWSQYSGGYVSFPFELRLPRVSSTTSSTIYGQDTCTRFTCSSWDSYNQCLRWDCSQTSSGQDSTITDRETVEPQIIIVPIMYFEVGGANYWVTCNVDNTTNTIQCPIKSDMTKVNNLRISSYVYYSSTSYEYTLNIGKNVSIYSDGVQDIINSQNQSTNAINNQTQQQQQQHEETMNSSTEDAENEAEGFFDDFDVPDTGGLSAIITAPLNTINSLLTNSCSNLVLPLPFVNEDLTLPCLYSIYNQYFGAFFTLYQTIILAIVSYRCIRSIYFDITGFMNPDDDRIEVMDL